MKSKILVIGSVVKDVTIVGGIKKEVLGGTGTNISFGLGTLGLNPTLVSVVGSDFNKKYSSFFVKYEINSKIFINKNVCPRNKKKKSILSNSFFNG